MEVSIKDLIIDDCKERGYSSDITDFFAAFYEYSTRYKDVEFNKERFGYNFSFGKKKYIAFNAQGHFGNPKTRLVLRLKKMNKYESEIHSMPDSIQKVFMTPLKKTFNCNRKSCGVCCCFLKWTYKGKAYGQCGHDAFSFDDFNIALIPEYWRILELEYNLKV